MNELDILNGLYGKFTVKTPNIENMQHNFMQVNTDEKICGIYRLYHIYLLICYVSGNLEIINTRNMQAVNKHVNDSALKMAPTHVFITEFGCYVIFAQKCFYINKALKCEKCSLRSPVCGEFMGILVDSALNSVLNKHKQDTKLLAGIRQAVRPFKKKTVLIRSNSSFAIVCLQDGTLLQYKIAGGEIKILDFPFCNPHITSISVFPEDVLVVTRNDAIVRFKLLPSLASSQLSPNLELSAALIRTSSASAISADLLWGQPVIGNCGPFEEYYTAGIIAQDKWVGLPGSGQIFRFVACFEDENLIALAGDATLSFLQFSYSAQPNDGFQVIKEGDAYCTIASTMESASSQKIRLGECMNVPIGSPNYSFALMSQNLVDSQTMQQAPFAGLYNSQDFVDLGGISMLDTGRQDESEYRQSGLL